MMRAIKHRLRAGLFYAGLDVRISSNMTGVDPLQDIQKFNGGGMPPLFTPFHIGALNGGSGRAGR